jgi:hypothetical protein
MKRLLMILVISLPLYLMAQGSSPVDKLFDKYADKAGFKRVDISGKLFASMRNNFSNIPGDMMESFMRKQFNSLQKITGICILTVEDKSLNKSVNFYKELDTEGFFKNNNYEVLMAVTGKDENVHFYGHNAAEGKYSELLMVIGGKENKVISIRGVIDPMEIGGVTKALDVDINRYSK